jgi:O-antigen/teichoic acid export membrane protein
MFGSMVESLRQGLAVIRLKAFDTSTPEGRSRERLRRLSLTTLASIVGKFVALLTPLVSIPLALGYLGTERFGLWMTITSVVGMMAFADLGLGDGLITMISRADGQGDRGLAARYVASGFFLLLGLGSVLLLGVVAVWGVVPWPSVFNVHSAEAARDAGPAVLACVACFAVNLPLIVVQRVQAGYQEGFQSQLWLAAGNLLALIALITAIRWRLPLPLLVLIYSGMPGLAAAANAVSFFGFQRPWLWPRWTNVEAAMAVTLLKRGLLFLLISVFSLVGMASDEIIAARVLGPSAVTQLYVPNKMFAMVSSVALMVYLPLWGANAEALARGDVRWVKGTLLRLLGWGALVLGSLALLLVLAGPRLLGWWVGSAVAVPFVLLLGLGLWSLVASLAGPGFMVLNGADLLKPQVWMYGALAVLVVPCKVLFARSHGVTGIVWSNLAIYLLTVFVPLYWIVRRQFGAGPAALSEPA